MLDLIEFIKEMRATSSSTEKTAIIAQSNAFIHNVLEATYNPYKQYYVTSKTCKKNSGLFKYNTYETIFELLDDLSSRKITGHDAIAAVNGFVIANCDTVRLEDIIYSIIDKDLKIRCGAKVINKAKPNLIPEFNVALAQEYKGKCDWQNEDWYASRKLDGVRCLAVVDFEGKCTLYSRMGKELTTLNKVKEAIEKTGIINTVFDGEICLMDENGNEDFQGVMKELRRKDHQIDNPIFMIFDMIHKPDFDSGKSTEILSERLAKLRGWRSGRFVNSFLLRYTDQAVITDGRHFEMGVKRGNERGGGGGRGRMAGGGEGARKKKKDREKKHKYNG